MQRARAGKPRLVAAESNPRATRWTQVCAWDGHELGEMDYVQVSAHERVCRFHYERFQTWLRDTSQTMYRAEGSEGESVENEDRVTPASS